MKFPQVFAVACCSIIVVLSESTGSNEESLRTRASAQLERLAPYRRTSRDQEASDEKWQSLDNVAIDPGKAMALNEQQILQIYRILPEDLQQDIARQVGGNRAMIEMLANPKYMELMMQERIKRSGSKRGVERDGYEHGGYERPPHEEGYPHEEYGGYGPGPYGGEHYEAHPSQSGSDSSGIIKGSTSLISGIAKGIIGGLVSASGSASKGSSSISASSAGASSSSSSQSSQPEYKPEYGYGHGYSYGDKAFDVWDFKKAIISTLMQAVKAISGGVIALKGQLIKGSGYLVSSKGKIITSTGDAITSLGRNIAKSAVHPPATGHSPHPGYSYDHPPESGHAESYGGPPPGIEEVGPSEEYHENSNYESPSEVDDQAGLLIVKPTKSNNHDDHHADLDHQKPSVTHSEDNYHGPSQGTDEKDAENAVVGHGLDNYQNLHDINHVEPHHPPDRPPSSYDVPIYYHPNDQKKVEEYPNYPPLAAGSPVNLHGPLSIQQSLEYPPIHFQYKVPDYGHLDLPHKDTSSNDLSVYSSLSIDLDPPLDGIKISGIKPVHGLDLPKFQAPANFHSLSLPANSYANAALEQPLKIPLLNPLSMPYWQNQGLLQPITNFDVHGLYRRRTNAQRRRSVSNVAHLMRLHRI